jgi:hypothetical protein
VRSVVSEGAIRSRLAEWGLIQDDGGLPPVPGRSRTLLCRDLADRPVLVKLPDSGSALRRVREGEALRVLAPLVSSDSPLGVPRLLAFDPGLGVLALEWIPGAETLHHYHRRTGDFGPALAGEIGRGIGYLHRLSGDRSTASALRERFREDADLLEVFIGHRPDVEATASEPVRELLRQVRRHHASSALEALFNAQQEGRRARLLHGDLRQANLVKVPKGNRRRLVFLDWELSLWGDPARDLGSMLSDYAVGALGPERPEDALSYDGLQRFARGLLAGYRSSRRPEPGLRLRTVRWIGTALLFYSYGVVHDDGCITPRVRRLTAEALQMVAAPEMWKPTLFGATRRG